MFFLPESTWLTMYQWPATMIDKESATGMIWVIFIIPISGNGLPQPASDSPNHWNSFIFLPLDELNLVKPWIHPSFERSHSRCKFPHFFPYPISSNPPHSSHPMKSPWKLPMKCSYFQSWKSLKTTIENPMKSAIFKAIKSPINPSGLLSDPLIAPEGGQHVPPAEERSHGQQHASEKKTAGSKGNIYLYIYIYRYIQFYPCLAYIILDNYTIECYNIHIYILLWFTM